MGLYITCTTGLATRLLDWSKNPLIALFFATTELKSKKDSAVYILDFKDEVINTNSTDPFKLSFSGVFYPKGLTSRVISQRGVFTISQSPTVPLEQLVPSKYTFYKLRIKNSSKHPIQKVLEQYGINEFSIYQDLDNLSNYLNRFAIRKKPIELL